RRRPRAVPRTRAQRPALLRAEHRTPARDHRPCPLMLDSASKVFFHLLAQSGVLKKLASRYGMRRPASFARRFIAGETVAEAIDAARSLEAAGFLHTLDHLGESVATLAEADAATRDYLAIINAVIDAGIGRNLSLKLTQLGL